MSRLDSAMGSISNSFHVGVTLYSICIEYKTLRLVCVSRESAAATKKRRSMLTTRHKCGLLIEFPLHMAIDARVPQTNICVTFLLMPQMTSVGHARCKWTIAQTCAPLIAIAQIASRHWQRFTAVSKLWGRFVVQCIKCHPCGVLLVGRGREIAN